MANTRKQPALKKTPVKSPIKKSAKPKKNLADYGIIEDLSKVVPVEAKDDLGKIAELFPLDYSKLQASLQNGRDNSVTNVAVIEREGADVLALETILLANGSAMGTNVLLKHGREFVRRLSDLLDRAEAEGLNVGQFS